MSPRLFWKHDTNIEWYWAGPVRIERHAFNVACDLGTSLFIANNTKQIYTDVNALIAPLASKHVLATSRAYQWKERGRTIGVRLMALHHTG
jgi:hypothetical protein